jgi:hypothetical protein
MKHIYLPLTLALAAMVGSPQGFAQTAKPQPEKVLRLKTIQPEASRHIGAVQLELGGGLPDDCASALALTVGATCAPVTVSAAGATQSLPPIACNGFTSSTASDVWVSFVATSQVSILEVLGIGNYDAVLQLFTGSCGDLTEIGCVDNTFPPNSTLETATILTTVGNTYFVRIYNYTPPVIADNSFTVCVYAGQDPPPNNECTGAVPQPLADGGTVTFTGNNTGATNLPGTQFNVVWEAFTLSSCANVTIDYCVPGSVFEDFLVNITSGCPDFLNGLLTGTVANDCTVSFTFLPAGTYYIPVLVDAANTPVGPYTISASAVACPPGYCAASADECDEYIARVQFGDIDNSSGCVDGPAVDYTGISTEVEAGATVPIIVTNGPNIYASDQVVVWIDWNQNQSFLDAGEAYPLTSTNGAQTFTGNIVVPPTALPGPTVMRIRMMWTGTPSPCGSSPYGEVEDYTVIVIGGEPCDADAGTLTPDDEFCYDGVTVTLSATPNGDIVVPADFEVIYVLTEGADLVIIDVNADPEFDVEGPGEYTIHTLVYDPATLDLSIVEIGVTTGFDVNNLLIQGGGEICASLDVAGAAFTVLLCCDADAGTLSGGGEVCFEDNSATLTATPDGNIEVPAGFEVIYVLTEGAGLVIIDVNATPEFEVDATGSYTIHTLVYDPATLDLSIVEIGVTTGFDVNGLLIQGGGEICASLDVAGAAFTVLLCCDADAGTLSGGGEVCFEDNSATLTATPDGNIEVPAGFEVIYVLTEGAGLVIIDVNATPEFEVDATGSYTIHTLVYDPTTLDLSIVEIGVTTGFDVNGLLIQGGGEICASLDVAGAAFTVVLCCDAEAGTLSGGGEVCLEDDSATLTATADGNAVVPAGYEVIYVLTEGAGLVIIDVNATPEFEVENEGSYTIHTLVYDPATLDLSIVVPGTTTGFDVNGLLIQGGGTICASLDVAGAAFTVVDCSGYCAAGADGTGLGLDERIINVTFAGINNDSPNAAPTAPAYSDFTSVSGTAEVGVTYPISIGVSSSIGTTYNSNQVLVWIDLDQNEVFDANELVFTSDIDAVNAYTGNITIPAGATLGSTRMRIRLHDTHDGSSYTNNFNNTPCGISSYGEVEDYTVNIIAFSNVEEQAGANWSVFPNPSNGDFTIQYGGVDGRVVMEVYDMTGRVVYNNVKAMSRGEQHMLSMAGRLAAGTYLLRLTGEQGVYEQRVVVR